ncbi:MAG: inositol monophosphatase family protein, partial [Pseudomonadota bacterium]
FIDIVVESGLQSYDIAALIPIIEGAGGQCTSWSGGSCAEGGQVVATGDPALHEQALEMLADAAHQSV